jgi:8-amino-7-oxononanoate synthase
MAPLQEIAELCRNYGAKLIVDEAHATGVIGKRGEGLIQHLALEAHCFARVHTFGKAVGCHGAIVVGSKTLRDYLVNFSRPFIYTTGMPASAVLAIMRSYFIFPTMENESVTPIQGVIIPGNEEVKEAAFELQKHNLDVRPILYPTVARGQERLRIVIHSFNTEQEIDQLLTILESRK